MEPPKLPPPNANNCLNSDVWHEKRSQREYGCHTPTFTDNLREKVCIFCDQRKPVSLEEQAFSIILENAELTRGVDSALCHLPHRLCWLVGRLLNANLLDLAWRLVPVVAEYGENRPSWFDVEHSKITRLSRFRLTCEVYQKLKPYSACPSVGISQILQYHSSVGSTYEDFWFSMNTAILQAQAETENGCLEPFKSAMSSDGNNVILVSPELTDHSRLSRTEFVAMKELHNLNKTFAIPRPIVFKPTEIRLPKLESHEISLLLEDLDPEVIFSVNLKKRTWSTVDLNQLGRVLLPCNNLTHIYLWQETTDDGEIEDVAPAVSRLLSHHPRLQKLGLKGFQLAGTLASFPLPPVEELRLCQCTFTEGDWNFMTNRSDLAFKNLFVTSYFYDIHFPSLCRFLQNQAPTLESLGLEFPTLTVEEICNILRIMAKFNKLRGFKISCMEEMDFASKEKIIIDIMSIHSAREFFIDVDESNSEAEIDRLNEVVRRSCKVNRRPPIRVRY